MPAVMVAISLAIATLLARFGFALYAEYSRDGMAYCPRCGSVLDCDPERYRGVVHWSCDECGGTFETVAGRHS